MKSGIVIACLISVGIVSCKMGDHTKKTSKINRDTLTYTYKIIKQKAENCDNKADSSCTIASVKYPEFKQHDGLNKLIKEKVIVTFHQGEKTDTSIMQLVRNFLSDFGQKKDTIIYALDCYAKVLRQDSGLVTLQYGGYTFQGGAHGSDYTGFVNWNTKADKEITFDDLFIDGYRDKLVKIADTIFRKNEKLSMNASLAGNYFFKDDRFALPANYSLTPLGIRFFYNEYEIKPYAAGTTDLFISYSKLKNLLRSGSVILQYLK